jgi:peptidoglycan hydrolase-like protein with peptidoglycan-binding domain
MIPSRGGAIKVNVLMGNHFYNNRANKLKIQDIDVYDFGSRALRESCFGEDVAALQSYLVDEGYLSTTDGGPTGYFGSVTREALQNWQRDVGVNTNGVFNADCKWAYLKQQEARYNAVINRLSINETNVKRNVSVAVPAKCSSSSSSFSMTATKPAVSILTPALALFALGAGAVFGKRTITSFLKSFFFEQRSSSALEADEDSYIAPVTGAAVEEEEAMPFQIQENEPTSSSSSSTHRPRTTLRRLSDQEIQARIAPLKKAAAKANSSGADGNNNKATSRATVGRAVRPIRPSSGGINVSTTNSKDGTAAAEAPSKYGHYYGGRTMYNRFKELVLKENTNSAPEGLAASGSSRRMNTLGYNTTAMSIPASGGSAKNSLSQKRYPVNNNNNKNSSSSSSNYRTRQSPAPQTPSPQPSRSFEDVQPVSRETMLATTTVSNTAVADERLLFGTDLETAPVMALSEPPVKLVRPGQKIAAPAATVGDMIMKSDIPAVPKAAAVAPKPVAVVKPKRLSGEEEDVMTGNVEKKVVDPNATVVLSGKPIKLHKPARLASRDDIDIEM